jgi:hypothetical protein
VALILPGASVDEMQTADGTIINVCHVPGGRITIGNLSVDMPMNITPNSSIGEVQDGIIGDDFLNRYDVKFDFRGKNDDADGALTSAAVMLRPIQRGPAAER